VLVAASSLVLAPALAPGLSAHPLAPSLLELREQGSGRVEVTWKTPAVAAPGERLRPLLPSTCAALTPPQPRGGDDLAIAVARTLECPTGLSGSRLGVEGLDAAGTQALLRLVLADGRVVQTVLTARAPAFTVPGRSHPLRVAADYLALGVEHIAGGADHLLFVLGLLLLLPAARSLALAITGFTLGHSVTLSLAALGYASLPSGPIEVCIALSVLALALELTRERRATILRRFPWAAAAAFGLLHGLGFAGALRDVGLPSSEVPLALLSFNGGIEIGQLAFVGALLAVARAFARLPLRLPRWSPQLPAYAMGSLAVFWSLQRAAALLP
jgi:hypothetical protein